jgi:predicted phage tail protein
MGTHTFDSRYAYELYTDNGVIGGQFTKIANTNQSQYTVENLTSGTYRFKVRARTPCGEGNYSNFATATVDLVPVRNTEPARMAVLNIEQQDCHVKVSWVAPESGSQPITGYQLQVGSGTLYNDITAVCGVMLYSSSCVIPM